MAIKFEKKVVIYIFETDRMLQNGGSALMLQSNKETREKPLTNQPKDATIQRGGSMTSLPVNLDNLDKDSQTLYSIEQVKEIMEMIFQQRESAPSNYQPACIDNRVSQQTSPSTKLTMSVREAAALIGISKTKVYDLVRKGEISTIRVGQKIVIPRQAIFDWIQKGVQDG